MNRRDSDTFDMFKPRDRGRFGDSELRDGTPAGQVNGASNLIDLPLVLHWQTKPSDPDKGAVLVSADGNETRAIWVPMSQCQIEDLNRTVTGIKKSGQKVQLRSITLTLPQWLAKEKGLL